MSRDWYWNWKAHQKMLEELKKMGRPCYVCGKTVPEGTKNYLYCSGACKFYMMNRRGAFMIGDHPELTEKRIYTT